MPARPRRPPPPLLLEGDHDEAFRRASPRDALRADLTGWYQILWESGFFPFLAKVNI